MNNKITNRRDPTTSTFSVSQAIAHRIRLLKKTPTRFLLAAAIVASTQTVMGRIIVCGPGDATGTLGTVASPHPFHRLVYTGYMRSPYGTYTYAQSDTIQLVSGSYFATRTLHDQIYLELSSSATKPDAAHPLVIMPCPNNTPVFKAWDSTATGGEGRTAIITVSIGHVYIIGLTFDLGNVTGGDSYHGELELADNGNVSGCKVIHCNFLNGVQVVFRDQATVIRTELYGNTFLYAGRSGWSNKGYPNYTANSRVNGAKLYEANFFKDMAGDAGGHYFSESGNVDSIHAVHNMFVQSDANKRVVTGGYSYWNAVSQRSFIKSGTTAGSFGLRIDSCIYWTAYDFTTGDDAPVFSSVKEDKLSTGTRIRYTWFLRGYLSTEPNTAGARTESTTENIVHWSDRYPQNNLGMTDTNWTRKSGNRYYVGPAKPNLADRIDFLKSRWQSKRARVHVVNLDSSATITISAASLATTFTSGDTLRIVDLQNHPDSSWQRTVWNGSSDLTITMPNYNSPYLATRVLGNTRFMYEMAAGRAHTDRRIGAFDIRTGGTEMIPQPIPSAPTLAAPASGATGQPITLTLQWNASNGATSYRVQLSVDSLFGTVAVDDSSITDTSLPVGPLANITRYFWRVQARNTSGISPFSSVRSFTTTSAPPTAPTGTFSASIDTLPAGGGTVALTWTSQNATTASIDQGVGTVPLSGSVDVTIGVSTIFTLLLSNQSASQSYLAAVIVRLPSGQGVQDITMQGAIVALVTNPQGGGNPNPEVIRDGVTPPVGNGNALNQYDTYTGTTRSFDWIGYTFSQPRTFSSVTFQEGIHFSDGGWFTDLRVQVHVGAQWVDVAGMVSSPAYAGNNGQNYETYDLVFPLVAGDGIRIAGTPGGPATFISVAELRVLGTDPTPINPDPSLQPRDYSLAQNYPNPFNPSTNIEFGLPRESDVVLTVYDVLGREIAELVNGHMAAGRHRVLFSADGFSNGIYFYAIRAGSFTELRKMVLLK